jgi:hypothetical protein
MDRESLRLNKSKNQGGAKNAPPWSIKRLKITNPNHADFGALNTETSRQISSIWVIEAKPQDMGFADFCQDLYLRVWSAGILVPYQRH